MCATHCGWFSDEPESRHTFRAMQRRTSVSAFHIDISGPVVFWVLVGLVATVVWWGLGYLAINGTTFRNPRIPLPWAFVVAGPIGWICAYLYYCTSL